MQDGRTVKCRPAGRIKTIDYAYPYATHTNPRVWCAAGCVLKVYRNARDERKQRDSKGQWERGDRFQGLLYC